MSRSAQAEAPMPGGGNAAVASEHGRPFAALGNEVLDGIGLNEATHEGRVLVGQAAIGFYLFRTFRLGEDTSNVILDHLKGRGPDAEYGNVGANIVNLLVGKALPRSGPRVRNIEGLLGRLTDLARHELSAGAAASEDPTYAKRATDLLDAVIAEAMLLNGPSESARVTPVPKAQAKPASPATVFGNAKPTANKAGVDPSGGKVTEAADTIEEDGFVSAVVLPEGGVVVVDEVYDPGATELESIKELIKETVHIGVVADDDEKPDNDRHRSRQEEPGNNIDSVRAYLKQIGKIPLLSAEQEVGLSKRIEAGLYAAHLLQCAKDDDEDLPEGYNKKDLEAIKAQGISAKNRLLQSNLRLVVSIVKRYTGRGMAFLDLIQEGNLGLIRAVEKFDYTKGYKFSTYATWWIRQAATRAMADQARTIRIPVHMVEIINKTSKVKRELTQELGRTPTPEEMAKELNITPENVLEIQALGREPVSLDQAVGEEGSDNFGDLVEDSDAQHGFNQVAFKMLRQTLDQVIGTLSEREASVARLRFGLTDGCPRTFDEISRIYGVTRERIRQIEAKTLSKLRHPSRRHILIPYRDFFTDEAA